MEQLNYSESRNTEENKDFLKKIDEALQDDGKINIEEAKAIQEKYRDLRSHILSITKEELSELAH